MILFHASYMEIVKPDIMHSRMDADSIRHRLLDKLKISI